MGSQASTAERPTPTTRKRWPPVESERLRAQPLGENRYRIDNTPWFVRNLSADDVIEALADDGVLWATKKIESSGRLTVRVIPLSDGPAHDALKAVMATFAELGAASEGAGPTYPVVALDIPPEADHAAILSTLRAGGRSARARPAVHPLPARARAGGG